MGYERFKLKISSFVSGGADTGKTRSILTLRSHDAALKSGE
jgi:hypothetical protein